MENASNQITVNLAGVTNSAGTAGSGTSRPSNSYAVDTRPPVVDMATSTVDGTRLTLVYSQALATGNLPPASAFAVTAGGQTIAVSTVAVGTDGYSLTLTLARAVTAGQEVRVSYTDPTAGDDANAVQDSAGNDAASFSSQQVVNDTVAVDSTKPTISSIAVAPASLRSGQTATVTFGFSEPVTGFAANDMTVPNGTISTPASSDLGITWTATLTPTPGVEDASNQITVKLAGLTDLADNAGTGTSTASNNYAVDTKAPAFETATVNGSQLVLTYTEGSSLDATNKAAASAFAVQTNGTANAVTAVAVDATAKTVTLTLTSAVTTGQTVTVGYTDPTAGDDANAVQDSAGNDAASFAGRAVTNDAGAAPAPTPAPPAPTPAPPAPTPAPPAPTPAPTPASEPANPGPDLDSDGASDSVEDQAPGIPGPNGAAALAGDGNGDGLLDSKQPAVGSVSFAVGGSGRSSFVTLVAGSDANGKPLADDSGAQARITGLTQAQAPANLPKGMETPIGLLNFSTETATGASEGFSLYVDPALGVNGYWVQDKAGTWVNLASEPYGGKMSMEGGRLRLDFHIGDGGQFDSDGQTDGVITAPAGAAAQMPLSVIGQTPDGDWF